MFLKKPREKYCVGEGSQHYSISIIIELSIKYDDSY